MTIKASVMAFCASQPRAQLLRSYSVTRANLQKDGSTLLQQSMIRYVEGVFNVVRSVMDARQALAVPHPDPNWADSINNISGVTNPPHDLDDLAEPDEVYMK
jgi:hypothetical protein